MVAVLNLNRRQDNLPREARPATRAGRAAQALVAPRHVFFYGWLAGALLVIAVISAGVALMGITTIFWVEIVVALLFAAFWGRPDRRSRGRLPGARCTLTAMSWEAIGVLVGLLAIAFGLVGPSIVTWWYRPMLRVVDSDVRDELVAVRTSVRSCRTAATSAGFDCRSTTRDGRPREDVRVILVTADVETSRPRLAGLPPSRECTWADMPTGRVALPLPPRTSRLVDVVHVARIDDSEGGARYGLMLGLEPLGQWDRTGPGSPLWVDVEPGARLTVGLTVMASNAAARSYRMSFDLTDLSGWQAVRDSLASAGPVPHEDAPPSRVV